ncbi:MAG: DNA-binding protein, putative [uncultured Sulfurovum sp.]|uniref:DNA-binding protein, putative n=1 Tax=uncultured Sulfurovum sp. TaxID=269237 RepID=A0A6S6SK25_9BACT|nr:MAG: DNA-binding protein, putative [uncultured Sulfurovum sp.]
MSDLQKQLEEELKDPEFKKEWDKLEFRYSVIKQLIKIRNTYNLSQAQLAEKLNTTQAVISRIENGTVNIGIDFIEKLAKAFDKKIEFRLI